MIVTYWGVRGSLPVPGPDTVRYGGNTACVGVEIAGRLLVLDAGTGIRALGEALRGAPREIVVLLSHRHADHLQGLPFFAPLFSGDRDVFLLDHPCGAGAWSALGMFDGVHVPMLPAQLAPTVRRVAEDPVSFLSSRGIAASRLQLRHPGGAFGWRLEEGGRAFVHLTDSEMEEGGEDAFFRECAEFCRGADVLSHDAQYLRAEMPRRRGRGHSSVERVCELAAEAGVGRLVLFHHDPERTDAELEGVERDARRRLEPLGIGCDAAREGMRIEL